MATAQKPEPASEERGAPVTRVPHSRIELLLVEPSDKGYRELVQTLATSSQVRFRVTRARGIADALPLLAGDRFDVALLDLAPDEGAGVGAIGSLLEGTHGVPIVVLGSENDPVLAESALSLGAQDYLSGGTGINGDLLAHALSYAAERKRAEDALAESGRSAEALRETEARYRQMFEKNLAVKLLIDPQTLQIIDANPAACEYYGYSLDQLRHMKISDINTLPQVRLEGEVSTALNERRNYFQFKHRLASGEIRDVEVHSSPLDLNGKTMLYSIIHDITERRQAEEEITRLNKELEQRVAQRTAQLEATNRALQEEISRRERLEDEVRQQAEAADSERRRLAYILANLPVGIYITRGDPVRRTMEWVFTNQVADRQMWVTRDVPVGPANPQYTLHHLDGSPYTSEDIPLQAILWHGKTAASAETLVRYADGSDRILRTDAILLSDDGEIRESLAVVQDITERKRLEEQVRIQAETVQAEYERLASLVAQVDVGITLVDLSGRYVIANDVWLRMRGFTREDVIGRRYDEIFRDAFAGDLVRTQIEKVLATGEPMRVREILLNSPMYEEGGYFDRSMIPIRDAGGNITGVLGATVDVTEKVRARQAVEEQRAMLRSIIEGVPVAILFCDTEMRVVDLNTTWARLVGLKSTEEGRGKLLYEVSPSAEANKELHLRVLNGETISRTDVPFTPPGQSRECFYDAFIQPMHAADGTTIGLLAAVVDVTERHELDQQKDEFIAMASHELKTPLTSIKGYSQIGTRIANQLGEEHLARMLRIIDQQTTRLTRLIDDMLDVSRLRSGELSFSHERFDLRATVEEVTGNLALTAPNHTIDLALTSTPAPVNADRQRIEQVITNLVQNAIKYSTDDPRIEIQVTVRDGKVVTLVRDHGVGIPANEQPQIFDRFFRARNVQAHQSGLGLGLYISNGIVMRHGGRMWLESAEGDGSTFYFTLPLAE